MADALPPMTTDELRPVGRLIRELHDNVESFEPRASSLSGRQSWARLFAEGHGDHWGPAADYIEARTAEWTAALRACARPPQTPC